jgi:tetratricopeptide (TPR) repeat protein
MRPRILVSVAVTIAAVAIGAWAWYALSREKPLRIAEILAVYDEGKNYGAATMLYPFAEAVFPPEISAPTFRWEDTDNRAEAWVIRIAFDDGAAPLVFESRSTEWTPSEEDWTSIKKRSVGGAAKVAVIGMRRTRQDNILAVARTVLHTSPDEVGAPIFYREVNLPFIEAVKDPSRIRWRFGTVGAKEKPPIVLENLPVCGNCHSFSKDGSTMGLDVDYANDKGSYAILPVSPQMLLDRKKIITWSDYRREDREPTFGLLSAVSPDGKYVVSTVKDRSVFVATDDLAYSQLFFPIKGILAIHNRQTGEFRSLPGADDPQFVQSNAVWSPDGKYLVFAKSKVYTLKQDSAEATVLLSQAQCREFLTKEKLFLFDLYRIPFNGGKGGKAEPLQGASHNGMSNYFAKYSPDGRWIVFCRAKSFMLLQPDSQLWIVPAEGGDARRLSCNLPGMNSWHSWSPNGRWLVFCSKVFTPYTQLFLTHIDERGESTPPVLLSRFTSSDRAANIPEFVNLKPDAMEYITVNFLDDYNFSRMAREDVLSSDLDRAEAACRKALELKPDSSEALCNLGVVMARRMRMDEAIDYFTRSVKSDPKSIDARMNLAYGLTQLDRLLESLEQYREVVRINPELFAARAALGQNLLKLKRFDEAVEQLSAAVRLRPADAAIETHLAEALQRRGDFAEAAAHYRSVLQREPNFIPALMGLAIVCSKAKDPQVRDDQEAMRLAKQACNVTHHADPEPLAVLAALYADAGHYAEAAHMGRQCVEAAGKVGNTQLARAMEVVIRSYERKAGRKGETSAP